MVKPKKKRKRKVKKLAKGKKVLILKKKTSAKKRIVKKPHQKKPKKSKKPALNKKAKKTIKITKKAKLNKVKVKKSGNVRKIKRQKTAKKTIKESVEFPAESLFKAKIKVIGIGGGGGSIVSEIGRSLKKATFVIADTDLRALRKRPGIKYFWFGENLTHGLGTGVNPELAKRAAETAKEKMSSIFKDQDIIIFIASLGGGLGSGATQVFAEAAREFGGITFGIFTLPFKFEGKNKQKIAYNALRSLRQSLNVSVTIPNERIFKTIDINTPITEAFSVVNKNLIESLESMIDLIYNPGIINIDFADLRTILKGRGNMAFLNTIEESGKDRADKICQRIFVNPLYQNNNFTAEKILFNIAGGNNLSMFEVEKVSRHIAELNPKAKIIFGISRAPKLKNKIKTTLLMTGGGFKTEEKVEPVKITIEKKAVLVKELPKKKGRKKHTKKKPAGVRYPLGLPVFQNPALAGVSSAPEKKLNIVLVPQAPQTLSKAKHGTIRRNALEIKKAQEIEEHKRTLQEKEWEIPAFLRKVKFKS